MTQEEREEIQARYNVAESYLKWTGELISEKLTDSVRDIPALLDAVEETEDMLGSLEIAYNELKAEDEIQRSAIRTLESDLSHEKQNGEIMANRAEALERAIKESPDPCWFCIFGR